MNAASAAREGARFPLGTIAVRIGALWILTGALFKLLLGTPADLPVIVRELPLDLLLTYRLAIAIELAVAAIALLRPRLGWVGVAGLLAVFNAILIQLMAVGAENCGCFGSSVKVPPLAMLIIDAALLLMILLGRPWRPAGERGALQAPHWAVVTLVVVGLVAPFALDRQAEAGVGGAAGERRASALPSFAVLDLLDWQGQPLAETPLPGYLGAQPPDDAILIFYRKTCAHCADHLFELMASDDGSRPIWLVRIVDEGENPEEFVVDLLPEGPHVTSVTLPEDVDWVVTTPAELVLEAGVVVEASEGA